MEIKRRTFLQLLGSAIGVATAAPVIARLTEPKLVEPPDWMRKPLPFPPLIEEILSKDSIFNHHCIVKSVSLNAGETEVDRTNFLGSPSYFPVKPTALEMEVEVFVDDPRLVTLAQEALITNEQVQIDLHILRRNGFDQSKLRWFLRGLKINASEHQYITMRMDFMTRGRPLSRLEDY